MDFPYSNRHRPASFGGYLEGLGTDTAQMAVTAAWVGERLDVIEDVGSCEVPSTIGPLLLRSFFRLEKKDSATALPQQLPRRFMLGLS